MKTIAQYEPKFTWMDCWRVAMQVRSSFVGPGDASKHFETEIVKSIGCERAATTNSGTTALFLAIKALNLPRGSAIAFPAYTFIAGANAALMAGMNIRLVDIKESTLCMNPDLLAPILANHEVNAVIFVDHNGYVGDDLLRVKMLCAKYGVPMIEDACQAFGISGAGRTGDLATLSFSPPKLITTGQGGAVLSNELGSKYLFERVIQLRDHGASAWRTTRIHKKLGANFRMSDIQAALGLSQMKRLERLIQQRRNVHTCYAEHGVELINYRGPYSSDNEDAWCAIMSDFRASGLVEFLRHRGIEAHLYYRPMFRHILFLDRFDNYPVADHVARRLLYLPSSPSLTRSQVARVSKAIRIWGTQQ